MKYFTPKEELAWLDAWLALKKPGNKKKIHSSLNLLFFNRGLKILETQTLDMDLDHKFSSKRDFIRGSLAAYVKVEDVKLINFFSQSD